LRISKFITVVIGILIVGIMSACSNDQKVDSGETKDGKLTIFTTIYPLQYFTERIGQDYVKTESLVPPGTDAHTFEPTTKTMLKLAQSNAFNFTSTG
jgi:zinc transport system substrate-binding protein